MQNSSNKNEIDFSNDPAILACWNSEEVQREFAAWQAEQAHLPGKEKQEAPIGELPVMHSVVICGLNRKFYKQCNSQQLVCDMQFTVVANESNRELRWQGASYSGTHPVFVSSWLGVRQTAFTGSFSPWLHRGWFCAVPPSGRTIPPLQGRREQRRHWFWYPVRRSFPCPQRTA